MDFILVLTVLAGCLMPVQPALSAMVARGLGNPYLSSFISFFVGTVALGCLCLAQRISWSGGKALPQLPWWVWTAGLIGAFFVTISIVAIPRLGATNVMALLIAGQMLMSLVMDHGHGPFWMVGGCCSAVVRMAGPGRYFAFTGRCPHPKILKEIKNENSAICL